MPSSRIEKVPYVINHVIAIRPKKVIDVGIGFGKYGLMLREYLELWGTTEEEQKLPQYNRDRWQHTVHGVEVFEDFIKDYHRYFYNKIFIGKIQDAIFSIDSDYDMAILSDVIEHMSKEEGSAVLQEFKNRSKYIIVTMPNGMRAQGVMYGNQYEEHKCGWDSNDLRKLNFEPTVIGKGLCGLWKK